MNNGFRKEILEEILRKKVVTKAELNSFLENKVDNPSSEVMSITKALISEGLITIVSPIGESCYAITQKGMREIKV